MTDFRQKRASRVDQQKQTAVRYKDKRDVIDSAAGPFDNRYGYTEDDKGTAEQEQQTASSPSHKRAADYPQESQRDYCQLYDETDWADFVLEQVDAERAERMIGHSRQCRFCRSQMWEWNRLLLPLPESGGGTQREAPEVNSAENRPSYRTDETAEVRNAEASMLKNQQGPYPSEAVKASLLKQVRSRAACTSSTNKLIKKGSARVRKIGVCSAIFIAASVAFLIISGLFRSESDQPPIVSEPLLTFIEDREPEAVQVVLAPDSRLSSLIPATDQGWGMIWLTVNTDEAVMLLEGLTFNDQADYQVWAVSGNHHESLGFLKQSGTFAHLHIRNAALKSAANISYSEEPKGGSPKPTSRKTVLYVLP
ncbi:anti-sigma factor [Paenibacillus senegalensis]|uniref:anti-sigma factor n=1 Tax=Paenibacillus senegalensis TaxID=1465766 RepID=UPI00028979E9|nr:anti-sigma factor [Paenibacillus senegalensis]